MSVQGTFQTQLRNRMVNHAVTNNRRVLEPIGDIPPAEKEQRYYQQIEESAEAA
jgi:hypothetical protein